MMDEQKPMEPDRIDLSPLDPRAESADFDRLLREIRLAATPELIRRQAISSIWGQFRSWRRPVLAASGLLALASAVVLLLVPSSTPQQRTTLAEAFGVPSAVAQWVQSGEKPTPDALLGDEGTGR
jgi:hypothetical protein